MEGGGEFEEKDVMDMLKYAVLFLPGIRIMFCLPDTAGSPLKCYKTALKKAPSGSVFFLIIYFLRPFIYFDWFCFIQQLHACSRFCMVR